MSSFFTLLKINIKSLIYNTFNFGGKTKGSKNKSAIVFGLMSLLIFGLMFMNFFEIAKPLAALGMLDNLFLMVGFIASGIVLIMTLFSCSGAIFKTKDFELLSSLPIKNNTIVINKILSLLLNSYFFSFFIFVPAIVIYFIFATFSISALLVMCAGFLVFPFIPTVIGVLLGFVVSYGSSILKKSNIVTLILTFAFFGVCIYLGMQFDSVMYSYVYTSGGFAGNEILYLIFPNIPLFISGTVGGNFWYLMLLLGIGIVSFSILSWVISMFYVRINQRLRRVETVKRKKDYIYKDASVIKNLISNEFKKFVSIPVYVINSAFGLLILLALPILVKLNILDALVGTGVFASNMEQYVFFAILIVGMLLSTVITTNSSISLEGKCLYLSKSMPISTSKLFISKILMNIILAAPIILISQTLFAILLFDTLTINFYTVLLILASFIVPLIIITSVATMGLFINLLFPKVDYVSEIQVVKQSISVFVSFMFSIAISVLAILLFSLNIINVYILTSCFVLLYIIILVIFALLLKNKGNKLLNKIE